MQATRIDPAAKRNKGFDQTHRDMIATAVRLVSEKGAEALSIAALAREMGMNRGTVYYHFENREALLEAVKGWASAQLARGMDSDLPVTKRNAEIFGLVLDNPDLMKMWIDDYLTGTDIRDSYPLWDTLVEGMQQRFDTDQPEEAIDAEVYCTIMLTTAFIAPRIFARSVRPDLTTEQIVRKFAHEQRRVLKRDRLDWE